jgi:hypothetical protein
MTLTTCFGAVRIETVNKTVEFKPETVNTFSFYNIIDYIYLIGTLRDGTMVAFQIGGKPYKSADDSIMRNKDVVYFNSDKCASVSDIVKYGKSTWYTIYIGNWRAIFKGGDDNKLMTALIKRGVKYIVLMEQKNDWNKFTGVAPASKENLKFVSEVLEK